MTPPESEVPDRPFPGAHAQVPGGRRGSASASPYLIAQPRFLPLEAARDRSEQGWVVRLRVRAEDVTVSKEVVIRERVVVRRRVVDDVVRIDTVIQREQLRLESEGHVEIARSADERGSKADGVQDDEVRQHTEHLAAPQGLP